MRRLWKDRSVFTTRIIANLDLPVAAARAPTRQRVEEYGVSTEFFLVAARSYDALSTALSAREEYTARADAYVSGSPVAPFLVRKCLLKELAWHVLPDVFNGTGRGSGLSAGDYPMRARHSQKWKEISVVHGFVCSCCSQRGRTCSRQPTRCPQS